MLTSTELILESDLRRDIVYGDHKDLVEQFQAHTRAQDFTPQAMQNLAEENTALRNALTKAKDSLANERARTMVLLRAVTELSLELEQTREQVTEALHITRLPPAGRTPGRQR